MVGLVVKIFHLRETLGNSMSKKKKILVVFFISLAVFAILRHMFINYLEYGYIYHQKKAREKLVSFHKLQMQFIDEHPCYSPDLDEMGIDYQEYTWKNYNLCFNGKCNPNVEPTLPSYYISKVSCKNYYAFLVGNLDMDSRLDIMMINEKGEISHLSDDSVDIPFGPFEFNP